MGVAHVGEAITEMVFRPRFAAFWQAPSLQLVRDGAASVDYDLFDDDFVEHLCAVGAFDCEVEIEAIRSFGHRDLRKSFAVGPKIPDCDFLCAVVLECDVCATVANEVRDLSPVEEGLAFALGEFHVCVDQVGQVGDKDML